MDSHFPYQRLYFIGIGGIGMSALARFFHQQHFEVAGYDRVVSPLTQELEKEGMDIHYDDAITLVPEAFLDPQNTLVVITPAIPADHTEREYFSTHGFRMVKRSALLGMVSQKAKSVAVAGTHGKTSISTMVAHIFNIAGNNAASFLGGICNNYQTNFFSGKGEWITMEADEFDRSFLQLFPDIAVVSAIDEDHLDIYGTGKELQQAFLEFLSQVKKGGKVLIKEGLPVTRSVNREVKWFTYGMKITADYAPLHVVEDNHHFRFDVHAPGKIIEDIRLGIPGILNVENAVAAIAVADLAGVEEHVIRKALFLFKGVKRRFDMRVEGEKYIYIDDYAHHPNEISATLASVRKMFPGREITVIFQPHLYSRTRDFAEGFARSLDEFDQVFLMDIYPAREAPIPGVNSGIIWEKMKLAKKQRIKKENLLGMLGKNTPEVLLTMGAGDIDRFVEPIEKIYRELEDA